MYVGFSVDYFPGLRLADFGNSYAQWEPNSVSILQLGYRYAPHEDWSVAFSGMAQNNRRATSSQLQATFRYKPFLLGGGIAFSHHWDTGNGYQAYAKFVTIGYKHDRFRVLASYAFGSDNQERFLPPSWELGLTVYFPRNLATESLPAL